MTDIISILHNVLDPARYETLRERILNDSGAWDEFTAGRKFVRGYDRYFLGWE